MFLLALTNLFGKYLVWLLLLHASCTHKISKQLLPAHTTNFGHFKNIFQGSLAKNPLNNESGENYKIPNQIHKWDWAKKYCDIFEVCMTSFGVDPIKAVLLLPLKICVLLLLFLLLLLMIKMMVLLFLLLFWKGKTNSTVLDHKWNSYKMLLLLLFFCWWS